MNKYNMEDTDFWKFSAYAKLEAKQAEIGNTANLHARRPETPRLEGVRPVAGVERQPPPKVQAQTTSHLAGKFQGTVVLLC